MGISSARLWYGRNVNASTQLNDLYVIAAQLTFREKLRAVYFRPATTGQQSSEQDPAYRRLGYEVTFCSHVDAS